MSDTVTWATLLARWTELARSAVALPETGEPGRWREAIPDVIALQAMVQALAEADLLAPGERAVALDRSELLLRKHAGQLHELWAGQDLPPELIELTDDARNTIELTRAAGVEWVVVESPYVSEHPADICAALIASGFEGDLHVPTPGMPLFEAAPAAYLRGVSGELPDPESIAMVDAFLAGGVSPPERASPLRQVYRQFDFAKGGPVRDLVARADDTLPAGQPLLVAALTDGVMQPVTLPPRSPQDLEPLPVVFADSSEGPDA